jgi:hypothetical protein
MGEIQFSNNFSDHSIHSGVNAGFQFEFYCQRCHDAWRSEFVAYRSGQASNWIDKASHMFGGIFGRVGDAAHGLAEAGYGKAHDAAFVAAIANAKANFHRCGRCMQYTCGRCFNTDKGLCFNCAPDAEVEIEAAAAAGEVAAAADRAKAEGEKRGAKRDVQRARQLVCPKCGAETHGAKFCPDCGEKLAVMKKCPKCSAEISSASKFCPDCGQKTE